LGDAAQVDCAKSGRSQRALADIEVHIRTIENFIDGYDEEKFYSDSKTVFAVIRCLEIISEASRRLPDTLRDRHPSIPWKDIAGAGNVYRHDYGYVHATDVWITVSTFLPRLSARD
jgi:uncharacterized protein with HEPN domain